MRFKTMLLVAALLVLTGGLAGPSREPYQAAAGPADSPPLPSSFYGTVKLDNVNVPAGAPISAWIDGVKYAEAPAAFVEADATYRLDVPADDPSTPAREGGRAGEIVVFQVAGYEADQTARWRSGAYTRLDLSARTGPDLVASDIEIRLFEADYQALLIKGTAIATVANRGNVDVPAGQAFTVTFFEDRDRDGRYRAFFDNYLGEGTYGDGLAVGASAQVVGRIEGDILFRDNRIHAFVDSGNTVSERDETNNVANTNARCEYRPPVGQFDPVLEWSWTSSALEPSSLNVMMTPAVIDLNADGIPDVVFASTASTGGRLIEVGVLRALSGDNGEELFTVTDPALSLNTATSIAAADLDLDGRPEIVAGDSSGSRLIVFEHDGTFKWRSPALEPINWGAPAIADLDGDGTPEIVIGRQAINSNGSLRWTGAGGKGGLGSGPLSLIADVDMDGSPDVVAGNTVYRAGGSILWQAPLPDGYNAIGNFDDDPFPEIVLVTGGTVRLLEHTGAVKWGPVNIPGGGNGGPPTVADYDGDGLAEIGVAGAIRYAVFETDGTLKWAAITQDSSSNVTGSSVFDFEGDGAAEVVYRDELRLRVYRGADGAVLFETPMSSCTWYEYVLVADVDADGNAEIVAVANNNCGFGSQRGVFVYGDANDTWVPTRQIWNQHTYHITNVNEDGSIPVTETNNWEVYNNYRCNSQIAVLTAPDLTASHLTFDFAGLPGALGVTVRIGNGGALHVGPGLPVAFYDGDPTAGGALLGRASTAKFLYPGEYEDVTFAWAAPALGLHDVYVVADDDGTPGGTQNECDETNNVHHERVNTNVIGPDLVIPALDRSGARPDPQALTIAGEIAVRLKNQGNRDVVAPFAVILFEDTDGDGAFVAGTDNTLGERVYYGALAVGQSVELQVAVSGTVRFRDDLIYAFADSGREIDELNEDNNLNHTGLQCEYPCQRRIYTSDADFDQGTLLNLNHDDPAHEQLQLNRRTTPFPFIWIALSGRGTVAKVDTVTGGVLGEYKSAPDGRGRNPSRTTVDLNGNVWVANRNESAGGRGSVVHIGLLENWQCVDRNGNGQIDTSTGLDDVKPWPNPGGVDNNGGVSSAADECIIHYTRVAGSGTRTVAVDANNDVWTGGYDDREHEKISGETGLPIAGTQFNAGCGGYGGLVDGNGVLWSANPGVGKLLRYDPVTKTALCIGMSYSYGLGIDSQGNTWNSRYGINVVSKVSPDGTIIGTFASTGSGPTGLAVTLVDDHVWLANRYSANVTRLDKDGNVVATIPVGSSPTGVAEDVAGKVWVTNYGSHNAMRIDPATNAVDLTVPLGANASPYNYSDMTGIVALGATAPRGTWSVIYDSGLPGAHWGTVRWTSDEPPGSAVAARARAAETPVGLGATAYVAATNGADFDPADGRYLQVELKLTPGGGQSPTVYDVTVETQLAAPDATASRILVDVADYPAAVHFTVRVGNGGSAPIPAGLPVAFYDGDPASGGVLLGRSTTSRRLVPGEYEDVTFTWRTPQPGLQTIYVVADDDGAGRGTDSECDETNNAHWQPYITGPVGPDLIVPLVDASGASTHGRTLALQGAAAAQVRNQGTTAVAGDFAVAFFEDLDGDAAYTAGADRLLGWAVHPGGLASGAAVTVTAALSGAVQFVGSPMWAFADSDLAIAELDEANNLNHTGTQCRAAGAPAADLTLSYLRGEPADSVDLTVRVGNAGQAAAAAGIPVAFYGGDPAAGGTLLGNAATTVPLPGGAFQDVTIRWTGEVSGTHAIFVQADVPNAVNECNEANNLYQEQVDVLDIPLVPGWNLLSGWVNPHNTDIAVVQRPISGTYVVILGFDQAGRSYYPHLPPGLNTLTAMDAEHGYWIKAAALPSTLRLVGTRFPEDRPLALDAGWNLVSFLARRQMGVSEGLRSIDGEYTAVLGFEGGALSYYSHLPPEFNTLWALQPLRGYWLRVEQEATLRYPRTQPAVSAADLFAIDVAAQQRAVLARQAEQTTGVQPTPTWVNFYGPALDAAGQPFPAGALVTAFDPQGVACGAAIVTTPGVFGLLACYGDDPLTPADEGAVAGDVLTFTINGESAQATPRVVWTGHGDLAEVRLTVGAAPPVWIYLPLLHK